MNNQINIAPPPSIQEPSPDGVLNLYESLRSLIGAPIIFTRRFGDTKPLIGWPGIKGPEPIRFRPVGDAASIAAVDSSCRRIAETPDGTVYAVRGAAVQAREEKITGFRTIGPLLVHLTPDTCEKLVNGNPNSRSLSKLILVDPQIAERFLRNKIERLIQYQALSSGTDILLVDGSLRASKFDDLQLDLRILVKRVFGCGASVIGISKTTRLKVLTRCISNLAMNEKCPSLIDVKEEMGVFSENLVGHPFVVRFSLYGDPLRVDVASSLEAEHVLGALLANDIFYAGYPESLRLAHHLCVIKNADVASIEGFMVGKLDVEPQPAVNARLSFLQNLPGAPRY